MSEITREEELRQKIADIDRQIEEGVSLNTKDLLETSKAAFKAELERIQSEATKAEVMDTAFKLFIGGQDITEGMAEDQKEFIALLYDEISARVSAPLKAEIQEQDGIIRTLKSTVDEKNSDIETTKGELVDALKEIEEFHTENVELGQLVFSLQSDINQLKLDKEDLEQKRDNAVQAIDDLRKEKDEEIRKLQERIRELETAKEAEVVEKRQAAVLESNERTNRLQELAKKFIKGESIGLYTQVIGQDGEKQFLHKSEIERMEAEGAIVTEFPVLPEISFEQEPIGIEYDVEESPVVFGGSEDTEPSYMVEEASETTSEAAEVTQETAYSEEVGETFEQRTERRLKALEYAVSKIGVPLDGEAA